MSQHQYNVRVVLSPFSSISLSRHQYYKNRLARETRALLITYLPRFLQTKVVCAPACYKTHTNIITTMVLAGGNGLLTPHTRHCARLMGGTR